MGYYINCPHLPMVIWRVDSSFQVQTQMINRARSHGFTLLFAWHGFMMQRRLPGDSAVCAIC